MEKFVQQIALDVAGRNLYKYVYAKQGDSGSRFVKATILADGKVMEIGSGMTAKFRAEKPDGKAILNPATVNDDGTVTVELTKQTLAADGVVDADIVISSASGEELSTVSFKIEVEKAPSGSLADSKNEMLVLQKLIDDSEAALEKLGNVKDGKDGVSPTVSTAATTGGTKVTITDAKGSHEFVVKDGAKGADGVTPHIGDNGNWYLGTTDTGKPSRGAAGSAGKAGKDGKSAYQYAVEGGYTGTETEFVEKLAQEQLIGTTNDLTPTQVYDAVSAGIPVKVQYTDSTYGLLSFTAFNVAESLSTIVSQTIVYYNGVYILAELFGNKSNGIWGFMTTTLAEKKDIPSKLPNPNALTIKIGSTTVTYDGSTAQTVTIADGSEVSY